MPGKRPSWIQQAFDFTKKRPDAKKLDEELERYLAPTWDAQAAHEADEAEQAAASQEMAFDDWRRHKYYSSDERPKPNTYRSNHAAGNAYDLNVTDEDPLTVEKLTQWAKKNLNQQQFPGMPSRVGPRPLAYRPWEDIETKGTASEEEERSRVCIWCGITCASIDELEAHEDDCA